MKTKADQFIISCGPKFINDNKENVQTCTCSSATSSDRRLPLEFIVGHKACNDRSCGMYSYQTTTTHEYYARPLKETTYVIKSHCILLCLQEICVQYKRRGRFLPIPLVGNNIY